MGSGKMRRDGIPPISSRQILVGRFIFCHTHSMFESLIRRTPRPQDLIGMSTQELRDTFQITNLFVPGEITGHFTDLDRLFVGGVMPTDKPVNCRTTRKPAARFFSNAVNSARSTSAGQGKVIADGKTFSLEKLDCVYLPLGTKSVSFESDDKKIPRSFIS
jgi:5-keto 4-deoxyuronate isomerase